MQSTAPLGGVKKVMSPAGTASQIIFVHMQNPDFYQQCCMFIPVSGHYHFSYFAYPKKGRCPDDRN